MHSGFGLFKLTHHTMTPKNIYFDCFAGAAGDMIVGALLDAGADFATLQTELAKLNLDGYSLRIEAVRRRGLGGSQFHVDIPHHDHHEHEHQHEHHHHHRGLSEILTMIEASGIAPRAKERAKRIFEALGTAEAGVHRVGIEHVHFHEVGAVDSIIDIVGACIALELLGVDEVYCSPIPAGSGTIQCDHGLLPVPAPATAALLVSAKLADTPLVGEVTTPTAAAILTTLASSYGPLPAMAISSIGYGAGSRQTGDVPNLLRVFVGEAAADGQADTVIQISANLDDCTGEIIGATIQALLDAGCVDAWATPIYMKKNRPAVELSALCMPADVAATEDLLFQATTTFGLRRQTWQRSKLLREHQIVETLYGPVRIKTGSRAGKVVTASPEFADCQRAAASHHVSIRQVMDAASAAYRTGITNA